MTTEIDLALPEELVSSIDSLRASGESRSQFIRRALDVAAALHVKDGAQPAEPTAAAGSTSVAASVPAALGAWLEATAIEAEQSTTAFAVQCIERAIRWRAERPPAPATTTPEVAAVDLAGDKTVRWAHRLAGTGGADDIWEHMMDEAMGLDERDRAWSRLVNVVLFPREWQVKRGSALPLARNTFHPVDIKPKKG